MIGGTRTRASLRRAAAGLLMCTASAYLLAAEEDPARECGAASNCGGLGGWRLILLADEPAPRLPDLTVDRPEVVDATLTTEQSFRLTARVRNEGRGAAAATTLRWYRSTDRTISTDDTEVGTDAVEALLRRDETSEAIALKTSSGAGSEYFGACVDAVGEEEASNNCSDAVTISVETRTDFFGAVATSVRGGSDWVCAVASEDVKMDVAGTPVTDQAINAAKDGAVENCRQQEGGVACAVTDTWTRGCAGVAIGVDRAAGGCAVFHYGGTANVPTLAAARSGARSRCREVFSECHALAHCDDRTAGTPPQSIGVRVGS